MIKPPYLQAIYAREDAQADNRRFPTNLPIFRNGGFQLRFEKPVTIIVGDNGAGKSTILEAIASHCGFSLAGGSANHIIQQHDDTAALQQYLRFSWRLRMRTGFFLRAETLQKFGSYLDDLAEDVGPELAYSAYGGKSIQRQSHGEGFLGILENRLSSKGIYILDEPEAALAPSKQLRLLALLQQAENTGLMQIIIATHSPIIMSYPHADLIEISEGKIEHKNYKETEHFKLYARFLANPEKYHNIILSS